MAKMHLKIVFMDVPLQDIFTVVFQATTTTTKHSTKIKENVLPVKLHY